MSSKKKSILKAIEKGQDTLTEKELEERGQERLPAMPEDKPEKKEKKKPAESKMKPADKKPAKAEPSPAAVSVESTSTGAGEEPAKVMGQPRKYNEPLKSISFKLPVSAIEKMKTLSNLYGESATQYILKKIEADYTENKEVIDKILELKKGM